MILGLSLSATALAQKEVLAFLERAPFIAPMHKEILRYGLDPKEAESNQYYDSIYHSVVTAQGLEWVEMKTSEKTTLLASFLQKKGADSLFLVIMRVLEPYGDSNALVYESSGAPVGYATFDRVLSRADFIPQRISSIECSRLSNLLEPLHLDYKLADGNPSFLEVSALLAPSLEDEQDEAFQKLLSKVRQIRWRYQWDGKQYKLVGKVR